MTKGEFVVVDGLDGIGKGEIERALIEYEQKLGRSTFDSVSFGKAHQKGRAELSDFFDPPKVNYNTIITSEPTYVGTGMDIRGEMISNVHDRRYSVDSLIQGYSLDRLIQMMRLVIPAIENGVRVIQSRSCASTLCYQSLSAENEGKDPLKVRKKILAYEGNQVQLSNPPGLLIIPTIDDIDKLIERISSRRESQKDDKAIFENAEFQAKLKPFYESDWLKKTFEDVGTKVVYLDAGVSVEHSRKEAVRIYRDFLGMKNLRR